MVERALATQRGRALVERSLKESDIENELVIAELAKRANSPEELSDLIRKELPSLMNQLDLYIHVREIDWESLEIDDQELKSLAERLFRKFHLEREEVK